jgi:uncharacterized membrane protein
MEEVMALSTTNFWMGLAGIVYLIAGVFLLRKEIVAARGWDKIIVLNGVFIAASLAAFAPEHFNGPEFVQSMVPPWMPWHIFWPILVGCSLLAAGVSLIARKYERLSTTLLAVMFSLFVCMIYLPSTIRHPNVRMAWIIMLRDLSFAAGAWALAGRHSREASPQAAKGMILFARYVIAFAAIFYAVQHFLYPQFAPGVPLELESPKWLLFPHTWAALTGAILLIAGICLVINKKSRIAAAAIGAWMTFLTVFLYGTILILARGPLPINVGINYVADTLLYAGATLALASALPRDPDPLATPAASELDSQVSIKAHSG